MDIIPSILTDNPYQATELIKRADGVVERLHIDIIDGVFADNTTIDPSVLNDIEHSLFLDFHLMVNEPINWVEKCVRAGADRIIGHIEMMESVGGFIEKITEIGLSVGLAIDLNTKVGSVEKRHLMDVDLVLVMSVPAGFGGQKFHASAMNKIKELNEIRSQDETPYKIAFDGGITPGRARRLNKIGADEIVIGQRIFDGDLEEKISKYKHSNEPLGNTAD